MHKKVILLTVLLASVARGQTAPVVDVNSADQLTLNSPIYGCACGCGVFDVATSSMLPSRKGGTLYFEYDYQDQNHNRAGNSTSPATNNDDKEIRTNFYMGGLQYMFNRSWGVQVEVPFAQRHFETAGESGGLLSTDWTALGDMRLRGIYTGFSEDMSIGATFGLKLPTGDFRHELADRDTQIGTGSTDLLLGGFFRHSLAFATGFTGFVQGELDLPVLTRDQYRPGLEIDGAAGVYFESFRIGRINLSPVGQIIVSHRTSDGQANAAVPRASGYDRVLLAPGVEIDLHPFMLYADVELPLYQHFTGNQVAASALFKVILSYDF